MFYIVETDEQLEKLQNLSKYCYVSVITTNDNFHPILTGLVALYVRPLSGTDKGYIIPVCHDEGLSVEKEKVENLLASYVEIYILNKKAGLYHFNLGKNVIDLNLKHSMNHFERLNVTVKNSTYNWFYNRYGEMENLNQFIPISKIYEKCEEEYNQVIQDINEKEPAGFNFYNETATKAYFLVEQNGIRLDVHDFVEKYKPTNPDFSINGETVYTNYNLYNNTSRPTNSFNAVNFLALPKGLGSRRCFKPSNSKGYFAELDYDGFHIRLVSEQIGYSLSETEKAHKQLAKLYFGKDEITDEEYGKAKSLNFQMIYGSIPDEYKGLEFSKKIKEYTDKLWSEYSRTWEAAGTKYYSKVYNPISHKAFTHELEEMHPQKLMNYMVQSLETARNVLILCQILGYLARNGYKTKVVLNTYDSFLLDVYPGEDKVVEQIKYIMEGWTEHKISGTPVYPVTVKKSENLYFN